MAAELLTAHKKKIAELRLVPSDGGCFEVSLDGKLLYSKLATKRFPEPGEVLALLAKEAR
ncbi:MAG: Rdx family protein [Planctomycetes bacterium]|nr:Rdx family protein [Planctomycetota bacterium]